MESKPPTHVSELAEAWLRAVAERGLGHKISLGGALGLLHYLDYRRSDDVDAWWDEAATTDDQARIAQHRPLAELADPAQRAEAEAVRAWFGKEFLDALRG